MVGSALKITQKALNKLCEMLKRTKASTHGEEIYSEGG